MNPNQHTPLPTSLAWLAGILAVTEIVLSLADRGILLEPNLRPLAFAYGAYWAPLLHGADPLYGLQPVAMHLSHAFLHGSLMHMAMNTTILLALGKFCADRYGPGVVLPVFGLGAIAGGLLFGLIAGNSASPMVGASGAVFAFFGVWIARDLSLLRAAGAPLQPVVSRILALAGINVIMYFGMGGMLAWEAHLGGFLAGAACGWYFERRRLDLIRNNR